MSKSKSYVNRGMTIREMTYNAAREFPQHAAFRYKVDGVITDETFPQLASDLEALGTCLFAKGLKDTNVGLIGENSFPWFLAFLSVVCGGNTAVPYDKGLTKVELETCVSRSNISALFYDHRFEAVVDHIREKHPDIEYICMTGANSALPEMTAEGRRMIAEGYREFLDKEVKKEDVAVYLFTSGTTSESKIVMLSHDNICSNIRDMLEMEIFYPEDVNMAFLPFHHSFGLVGVLVFLSSGCSNVFCDGLKYVQKNFAEYGVSVFVGVPLLVENLYHKVMKQIEKQGKAKTVRTGLKLSAFARKLGIDARRKIFGEIIEKLGGKLRLIISGAAPLAPEVAEGLNDFGITTIQGYGLTETSPVLSAERPWAIFPGSVGTPMHSVKLRIDEPDENGVGEIVAQGPNVMLGYYNQPEETAEVIRDGWFYTGDLGRIDGKGNLWITGRKKNVIVLKNGKNIFPEEIEELINRIPYVVDSMIFTREKHNELVLWVEVRYDVDYMKEMDLDEKTIAAKLADALADINFILPKYKHVNHFILTSEPMIQTTTMKVKRKAETEKIFANWDEEKEYTVNVK